MLPAPHELIPIVTNMDPDLIEENEQKRLKKIADLLTAIPKYGIPIMFAVLFFLFLVLNIKSGLNGESIIDRNFEVTDE